MEPQIQAALIQAAGTVLAALIGGGSILLVAIHRKWIIELARSVEAYHQLETEWVKKLLTEEGKDITDARINERRGRLRKAILGNDRPDKLCNARDARSIRSKYFSYDRET